MDFISYCFARHRALCCMRSIHSIKSARIFHCIKRDSDTDYNVPSLSLLNKTWLCQAFPMMGQRRTCNVGTFDKLSNKQSQRRGTYQCFYDQKVLIRCECSKIRSCNFNRKFSFISYLYISTNTEITTHVRWICDCCPGIGSSFFYRLPTNTVSKIKNQRLSSKKYYLTLRLKYYIRFELC